MFLRNQPRGTYAVCSLVEALCNDGGKFLKTYFGAYAVVSLVETPSAEGNPHSILNNLFWHLCCVLIGGADVC